MRVPVFGNFVLGVVLGGLVFFIVGVAAGNTLGEGLAAASPCACGGAQ
jgi:hypothetical protein